MWIVFLVATVEPFRIHDLQNAAVEPRVLNKFLRLLVQVLDRVLLLPDEVGEIAGDVFEQSVALVDDFVVFVE